MRLTFPLLVLLALAPLAAAQQVRDTASLHAAIRAARPGSRILIAPGNYTGGLYVSNTDGTADQPIVIAAADPERPPRIVGKAAGFQFSGATYIELRDLTFVSQTSNGLNIDDADRPGRSHHITLKNIRVADTGPRGNSDGIKLSGLDDFQVQNCTVERWGKDSGSAIDMVGCHRGLIFGGTFKQGGNGNAIQMKGGSSDITIRRCKLEDYGERGVQIGGSTGTNSFRPPVRLMPEKARYEAKNITVEGCIFTGGEAAISFVGTDGATVRYNTIYRPEKYAVRILQETNEAGFVPSRDGIVEDNAIVFRSNRWTDGGVNVGPNTAPETFRFRRNLWYCEDRPDRSRPAKWAVEEVGLIGRDPLFNDPAKGDFDVKPGSPARNRGAHALPDMGSK